MRGWFNLADKAATWDRLDEAHAYDVQHMEMAVRLGDLLSTRMTQMHYLFVFNLAGRWDEGLALIDRISTAPDAAEEGGFISYLRLMFVPFLARRGQLAGAREALAALEGFESSEQQDIHFLGVMRSIMLHAEGRFDEALEEAERGFATRRALGLASVRLALEELLEVAADGGHIDRVTEIVELVEQAPPADVPPGCRALALRFRARLAGLAGDQATADAGFHEAADVFRRTGQPWPLAMTLMDQIAYLVAADRAPEAEGRFEEAKAILERLGARPALERLEAISAQVVPAGAASA
jgi:tetratricopeptide (TPR) repeat protein